jgi:hypothetical protein
MALTLNGDGRISGANLNIDSDGAATLPGLTVDTNTLHVDAANNRVGVGTSSPEQILDVNGGALVTALATDGTGGVTFDLQSNRATSAQARGSFYAFGPSSTSSYQALRANYVGLYSAWADLALNADTSNSIQLWTGGNERMRIDASGRVTMPYQSLFIGRHNNEYVSTFIGDSIIPLNVVDLNVGSHWNASTYRFTCPVAGVYECIGYDIANGAGPLAASIGVYKNGTLVYKRYTEDRDKAVFGKVSCVANDYLEFRVAEGTTTLYGNYGYAQYSIRLLG